MPSAEEERAVFEDDDDEETEGDDTEEDDDDADAEPLAVAPPATAAAPTAERLSGSAIPASSDRPPNPSHNPNPTSSAAGNPNPSSSDPSSSDLTPSSAHPQNGAIPAAASASASAPVAVSVSVSVSGGATPTTAAADPGRALVVSSASEERRPPGSAFDESRRLFQRLWTDEDEIVILRGFLDFTSRRGTTFASHQYDTGPFYEEMKKQLQFEFTKNQLIEKLRRLKKKYRNCVNRLSTMGKDFAFKSGHEQDIFEIARNIWRPGIKRSRDSDDDENEDLNPPTNDAEPNPNHAIVVADGPLSSDRRALRTRRRMRRRTTEESAAVAAAAAADTGAGTAVPVMVTVENSIPPPPQTPSVQPATVPGVIEETVKSCLSPLFKELINSAIGGGGGPQLSSGLLGGGGLLGLLGVSPPSLSIGGNLGSSNSSGTPPVDEKWRKQQILELEVYLKRIELVQEQIKLTLEELKKPGVS